MQSEHSNDAKVNQSVTNRGGQSYLKSNSDEALNDEFLLRSNGDEALNDVYP